MHDLSSSAVRVAAASPVVASPERHAPDGALCRWSSEQLLGDRSEAEIAHAGSVYRLRVTALGKLILTK